MFFFILTSFFCTNKTRRKILIKFFISFSSLSYFSTITHYLFSWTSSWNLNLYQIMMMLTLMLYMNMNRMNLNWIGFQFSWFSLHLYTHTYSLSPPRWQHFCHRVSLSFSLSVCVCVYENHYVMIIMKLGVCLKHWKMPSFNRHTHTQHVHVCRNVYMFFFSL